MRRFGMTKSLDTGADELLGFRRFWSAAARAIAE